MIKADQYFKDNLRKILDEGCWDYDPRPRYKDGIPARSKFITQIWEEYDISKDEFPITTLRPTAIKTGIQEILWIYQDQSNKLEDAHKRNIYWWDDWNVGDGTIGQRYGATVKQYRLMQKLLEGLIQTPNSRRHIINFWQNQDLDNSEGLSPCAYETIWSVRDNFLDLTLIQRSSDYIVAGYINKIQYVGLMMMVADHCGFRVGKFCHLVQNLHIYDRHIEAAKEILDRRPIKTWENENFNPKLFLKEDIKFWDRKIEDFNIYGTKYILPLKNKLELAI